MAHVITESVVVLGLIFILTGGYLRYHRGRMSSPPPHHQTLWIHGSTQSENEPDNPNGCP
jgi:hypothetical protein